MESGRLHLLLSSRPENEKDARKLLLESGAAPSGSAAATGVKTTAGTMDSDIALCRRGLRFKLA